MGSFIVRGGSELNGRISVSGSKNAALPVIFASLTMNGVSEIKNLPDITDVRVALEIISALGARITREGELTLIDTRRLSYATPAEHSVSQLRASTYLLGACLARLGEADIQRFGGCNFSSRPIDMHLYAAECFGGAIRGGRIISDGLRGARVSFAKRSVGATVNAMIMAASAEGESRITGCAREPHVDALADYLRSAGAEIELDGDVAVISGRVLGGGYAEIPGDMIEAGTYLCASVVCGGRVAVDGFRTEELDSLLLALSSAGVDITVADGFVMAQGRARRAIDIITGAYPGFPTDLQPIVSTVLATGRGGSLTEQVWQDRFGYLRELGHLGVEYSLLGSCARIYHSSIRAATLSATDLRAGAAAAILALAADGESKILNAERVMRGYERFVEKLCSLGAEIIFDSE